MIEQTFASKKETITLEEMKILPWYPSKPHNIQQLADAKKISVEEYMRRDKIVQELYATVKLKTGDTAFPIPITGYTKYGAVIVIGVCKTYKDFGEDGHWNDDNPMIITFAPLKDRTTHIFCTADYLAHRNPHLNAC